MSTVRFIKQQNYTLLIKPPKKVTTFLPKNPQEFRELRRASPWRGRRVNGLLAGARKKSKYYFLMSRPSGRSTGEAGDGCRPRRASPWRGR